MHPVPVPEHKLAALSARLSAELAANGFAGRTHLSGDDLAHLHQHRQVGHFLLLHVAQDLADYLHQLHHPYFDWQHPDIRASRDQLERLLSHHIRLDRAHFQQLAERAAYNSLQLLADPAATVESILFGERQTVPRLAFERLLAYFVYFDFALLALRDHYRSHTEDSIHRADFRSKFQKAVVLHAEQLGIATMEYRQQCWHTLTGEDLPDPPTDLPALATPEPAVPVEAEPEAIDRIGLQAASNDTNGNGANGYDWSNGNGMAGSRSPGHLRVEDIPMHLQFAFVQRMFGGDSARFREALVQINHAENQAAALAYLERNIITPQLFRREAQTVSQFLDLVQAHFAAH